MSTMARELALRNVWLHLKNVMDRQRMELERLLHEMDKQDRELDRWYENQLEEIRGVV